MTKQEIKEKTENDVFFNLKNQIEKEYSFNVFQCNFSDDPVLSNMRKKKVLEFIMEKCSICFEAGREQEREKIIKLLEEIEHQKWDDAEHCSCLGYAIGEVKETLK